nr:xylulose kinase-1 [Tanacetum cinerariifolium]
MVLTFADTHNMIAYLTKSNTREGFNQIIDFLNVSSIKYALTVNPNIYVSCIKQFWTSVSVKTVNDVSRLQALVDKKKVIISEATIRDALRFDDAEGIDCLPNDEIFTELSRMGTSWNEFSCLWVQLSYAFPQQVGEGVAEVNVDDVPTAGVADEGVVSVSINDVPAAVDEPCIPSPTPPTKPPPPSQDIPSTLQDAEISMDLFHTLLDTCTTLTKRVKNLEEYHKVKAEGGIIANMDADEDVTLQDVANIAKEFAVDAEIEESVLSMQDDKLELADLQEVVEVVTTAKLMTEVVTAASATITAIATAATLTLTTAAALTLTTAPTATRKRKGVGMTYDGIRPIFDKNFNSNVALLEKKKEQMEEEDSRALKRISESQEDKAAKKQKLDEEVEELRKHL